MGRWLVEIVHSEFLAPSLHGVSTFLPFALINVYSSVAPVTLLCIVNVPRGSARGLCPGGIPVFTMDDWETFWGERCFVRATLHRPVRHHSQRFCRYLSE